MVIARYAVAALALFLAQSSPAFAFTPRAALLAGNGSSAVLVDGPALSIGFVRPVALAYDASGSLYVVDQGTQRIRQVGKDNMVRTVAGSGSPALSGIVPGGYRDGPAAKARFNDPSAIVVERDGSLLIADTGNHCIRRLSLGVVSTFAGDPTKTGSADGPRQAALFAAPMGISNDGHDGYYVADYGNGLRHIDARGAVTKVNVAHLDPSIRSVAAVKQGAGTTVVIAGRRQFLIFHPETGQASQIVQDDGSGEPIGNAAGVIAIGANEFIYADPETHAVRYFVVRDDTHGPFNRHYAFPLTGPTLEDAANTGATLVPGSAVPFVRPVAVALAPNGQVAVADMASRRIQLLAMTDRRQFASGDIAELRMSDNYYRIAYISNSFAFRNITFEDTMGGWVERILNRDRARIGLKKPVKVEIFKLQTGLTATSSYIRGLLGEGLVDEIVWGINDSVFSREEEQFPGTHTSGADWKARDAAIISDMRARLAASGIGLFVISHPISGGYGNVGGEIETLWAKDTWLSTLGPFSTDNYDKVEAPTSEMLRLSKVSFADIYPAVWAYGAGPRTEGPVFGTEDGHLTPFGNRLFGELIAQELERARPWQKKLR